MITEPKEMVMNIEQVGTQYRELIDEIDAVKARHKAELRELEERKAEVAEEIRLWMQETGAENVTTSTISFKLGEREFINVKDWSKFYGWIEQHGDMEYLQKRVKSTEVLAYFKDHGTLPDGVEMTREKTINHRRKGN
jgi:hypothetical protein